jgi:hypothetical protein
MQRRFNQAPAIREMVLGTAVLLLSLCAVPRARAEEPVGIGREVQLFVDDVLIARKEGVTRKAHPCQKLDHAVLRADRPWERTDIDRRLYVYGTALPREDGAGYRLWYNGTHKRLLYATSEDGIHWNRPNLHLVEFEGSKANNLLDFHCESPSIVLDPAVDDPSKRYKMLASGGGYGVAYSPDGLHWQRYEKNPVLPGGDTCTLAYDPESGEFLAFHKRSHDYRGATRRRLVYLATSKDMQTWSAPQLVMAPDAVDDAQTRDEGGQFSHFYNMSAFRYGRQWLGLVTHFRHMGPPPEKGPSQSGQDGPIDVQLVHSRDGRNWQRCEDRSPVIPNGPYAYDAGCVLGVTNQPIVTDDEVWMYYSAITTTHGGYLPQKEISIARAAWRLDGWCSLRAGAGGGSVETVPLRPEGDRLLVNANASAGTITIAVLDPDGKPLPGYQETDCIPLQKATVRQAVRWAGHNRLPIDRPIRLRFSLRNADLFSYRVE